MGYECKVLADSISPVGARLTTFEVCFPRIVLAEFNTHRVFSRNSASSRAIPVEKMIKRVQEDPFIPFSWGKNQRGMQADQEVSEEIQGMARAAWLLARDAMVYSAKILLWLGIHKQITNRLLEPFMYHTVIVSSTEWDNFFNLRTHKDAAPEIRAIASMMKAAYKNSEPQLLQMGQWHLPLVTEEEVCDYTVKYNLAAGVILRRISAGRCCRVSYLTHDGKRDIEADIALCESLVQNGHMSPLEHQACPDADFSARHGNFVGWKQHRQFIPNEAVFQGAQSE